MIGLDTENSIISLRSCNGLAYRGDGVFCLKPKQMFFIVFQMRLRVQFCFLPMAIRRVVFVLVVSEIYY